MPQPFVSVIVPVHNGTAMLRRCLAALRKTRYPNYEILLVDDSSTEPIAPLADEIGARLHRLDGGPYGPARARNEGARHAQGEILFFTDADVEVHPDTLGHAAAALSKPGVDAAFGSYDLEPGHSSFLSQYKNLFHHFVHQGANEDASTFWSGCGAIRADVFRAAGGFDPAYRRPSIEDIEFGVRLKAAGKTIRLVKAMQVRHLKHWTLTGLVKTEVFDRGVPWTLLILRSHHMPADLNLKPRERVSALLALGTVGSAALSVVWPGFGAVSLVLFGVFVAFNMALYRFFARARGVWFALRTIPMHVLYYLYSAVSFGLGLLLFVLSEKRLPAPRPAPTPQADS